MVVLSEIIFPISAHLKTKENNEKNITNIINLMNSTNSTEILVIMMKTQVGLKL